jgi:hypothetical protein
LRQTVEAANGVRVAVPLASLVASGLGHHGWRWHVTAIVSFRRTPFVGNAKCALSEALVCAWASQSIVRTGAVAVRANGSAR